MAELDYDKIIENLLKNLKIHQTQINNSFIKVSIIPLEKYDRGFDREYRKIVAETTLIKKQPTIADFAEIIKSLEEYPENMRKLKKHTNAHHSSAHHSSAHHLNADMSVMNGTIRSTVFANQQQQQLNKLKSIINEKNLLEYPKASKTYRDYKDFLLKMDKLKAQLELQEKLITNYDKKTRELQIFQQKLSKLMPERDEVQLLFNEEQKETIKVLAKNIEDFAFILQNQDMFRLKDNNDKKLEHAINILTYAIHEMNK